MHRLAARITDFRGELKLPKRVRLSVSRSLKLGNDGAFSEFHDGKNEPVQVSAGSSRGGQQGHVAEPPRDVGHHRHGVRHGRDRVRVLFSCRPGHPLPGHARSRHRRLKANAMSDTATTTKPKRWYIVHAYSNFENKVMESIREQAKQRHLDHLIEEIMVPKEKVVEVRRGRKVDTERKFYPGYVLVKMDLTDEVYHLIKNTPKVTGFLGSDNKPQPISEAEAQRILHQVQEGI